MKGKSIAGKTYRIYQRVKMTRERMLMLRESLNDNKYIDNAISNMSLTLANQVVKNYESDGNEASCNVKGFHNWRRRTDLYIKNRN